MITTRSIVPGVGGGFPDELLLPQALRLSRKALTPRTALETNKRRRGFMGGAPWHCGIVLLSNSNPVCDASTRGKYVFSWARHVKSESFRHGRDNDQK